MANIVIQVVLFVLLIYTMIELWRTKKELQDKIDRNETRLIKMASKMAEMKTEITRVDESTGLELNRVLSKVDAFRKEYGDAAIDAQRETARAEKAWADGVNAIMSYGPGHYGRGDDT